MYRLDGVAAFCEAAYLLGRYAPQEIAGWQRGRLWERWVASTPGLSRPNAVQGPGSLSLFGVRAASGIAHELDAAALFATWAVITEAKAYGQRSPSKNDIAIFDRKTLDYYVALRRSGVAGPHWRVLASATPLEDGVRRYCYLNGIVSVEPALIPLPMLLRIAGKPDADEWLPEQLLAETVRLGEAAAGPLEARYVPDGPHHLRFDTSILPPRDLTDLLWLHKTLSAELVRLVNRQAPEHYDRRAALLLRRIGAAAA